MDTQNQSTAAGRPDGTAARMEWRSRTKLWLLSGIVVAALAAGGFVLSRSSDNASAAAQPAPPTVTVSKPLVRELDTQLGFLGQFSAVDQVEIRAQVGGTLTGIYFKDGAIVHKGDLLFTIDPVPYEIRLAKAKSQLETANSKLVLANLELTRAEELERSSAGTVENVQQRTSDQRAALAAVDDAKAQIRDAQFDLDHGRITAPFTGRIGSHQVSVGNLIAGSRAATSPTTLLATLVSLDPIYMNFDMSEADYGTFSSNRAKRDGTPSNRVLLAPGNGNAFTKQGTLDFVDNVIDRSSGTIHARATVPNPDLSLTPGEFARVKLATGNPTPTLLVPDASVQADQSQHVVMTVSPDGTVVSKHVDIGDMRGGLRVIRSGLTPDDEVVVDGIPYAAPGAKVAPKNGAIRFASTQGER